MVVITPITNPTTKLAKSSKTNITTDTITNSKDLDLGTTEAIIGITMAIKDTITKVGSKTTTDTKTQNMIQK